MSSTPLNESSNSIEIGIDLSDFLLNVEWDVMAVPATRQERLYECCQGTFVGECCPVPTTRQRRAGQHCCRLSFGELAELAELASLASCLVQSPWRPRERTE